MSTQEHVKRMAIQSWPHYRPSMSDADNERIRAITDATMMLPRALAIHTPFALDEIERYIVAALTTQLHQTKPTQL